MAVCWACMPYYRMVRSNKRMNAAPTTGSFSLHNSDGHPKAETGRADCLLLTLHAIVITISLSFITHWRRRLPRKHLPVLTGRTIRCFLFDCGETLWTRKDKAIWYTLESRA